MRPRGSSRAAAVDGGTGSARSAAWWWTRPRRRLWRPSSRPSLRQSTTGRAAVCRAAGRSRPRSRLSHGFSSIVPLLARRNVLNGDDVDGAFFAVMIGGDALVGDRARDHVLRRGLFGEDVVRHPAVAELELMGGVRRVVPGDDGIRRHGLGIRRKRRRAVLPLDGDGKIGHGVLPLFLRIGAGRDTTPHSFNDSDRGLDCAKLDFRNSRPEGRNRQGRARLRGSRLSTMSSLPGIPRSIRPVAEEFFARSPGLARYTLAMSGGACNSRTLSMRCRVATNDFASSGWGAWPMMTRRRTAWRMTASFSLGV